MRYYDEARHAIRVGGSENDVDEPLESNGNGEDSVRWSARGSFRENKAGSKGGRILTNMGGSGRCCICFDSVSLQNVAVVAFFCSHAYHETCLNDTSGIQSSEESGGLMRTTSNMNDNNYGMENGNSADHAPLRCILCTTASSAKQKPDANGYGRTTGSSEQTSPTWGAIEVR